MQVWHQPSTVLWFFCLALLWTLCQSRSIRDLKKALDCDGEVDPVTTTTQLFLTLSIPLDQWKPKDIRSLEESCVNLYNAQSLSSEFCAPDTTLLVECRVEEYTASQGNLMSSLPNALMVLNGRSTLNDNAFFDSNLRRRRNRDNHVNHSESQHLRSLHDSSLAQSFCDCQTKTDRESSSGIDFDVFIQALEMANPLLLDGQEVSQIPCDGGRVFAYQAEFEFASEQVIPGTPQQVQEFEQLFHGECNRWSVQECDPSNFVVISTFLDLENGGSHGERSLQGGAILGGFIFTVERQDDESPSTSLFATDFRRDRLQRMLSQGMTTENSDKIPNDTILPKVTRVSSPIDVSSHVWGYEDDHDHNQRRREATSRWLQQIGDLIEFPCYCEISRAPDGVPVLQEEVTFEEVNSGLARLFDSSTTLLSTERITDMENAAQCRCEQPSERIYRQGGETSMQCDDSGDGTFVMCDGVYVVPFGEGPCGCHDVRLLEWWDEEWDSLAIRGKKKSSVAKKTPGGKKEASRRKCEVRSDVFDCL